MSGGFALTVITPTTGKPSLRRLVDSIERQSVAQRVFHLLLWDDFRHGGAARPEEFDGPRRRSLVLLPGSGRNGDAPGSPLRAVGLMAAQTPWITFADDDVWWEPGHAESLLAALTGCQWASALRRIWSPDSEYLGVDRFESVGDEPGRRVPYEMCDNNVMVCRRELGTAAAVLYRETRAYNDDRLMYAFLKRYGGVRAKTDRATVNQVCPERLTGFFRANCSPE